MGRHQQRTPRYQPQPFEQLPLRLPVAPPEIERREGSVDEKPDLPGSHVTVIDIS